MKKYNSEFKSMIVEFYKIKVHIEVGWILDVTSEFISLYYYSE